MNRLTVLIFGFCTLISAQVNVVASVDKNNIYLNQYINFEIRSEGSEGFPQVDLSPIKDFTITSGPTQSSSYQMFNNRVTTAFTLSWNLKPRKQGKLTIPSLKVVVDGKSYRTKKISVEVSKSTKTQARRKQKKKQETQYVFLVAETDKREAYIGEQITVEFLLYTQVTINDISMVQKPQGIGFWKEELQSPRSPKFHLRERNGVRFNVASLGKIAYFATETGQLSLDPMILDVAVESRSVNRFLDDFRFGDPFSIFPRSERKRLESKPVELTIYPLPEEGRPEKASQAVGEFSLRTFIDTSVVEMNKVVTFTVELEGTGNLNLVEIDEPDFPGGVEIFDRRRPVFDRDVFRDDLTGVKRWEYIIMPRRAGRFVIPEMELAYFNPSENIWKITHSKPVRLNVDQGSESSLGSSSTSRPVMLLDEDIRYIRTNPVRFSLIHNKVIPTFFWWIVITGTVFFISPGAVRLVQGDKESRRKETLARSALRRYQRQLKQISSPEGYGEVADAVSGYVSDKFGLPHAGMDGESIDVLLKGNISDVKREELGQILKECNEGRFSPKAAVKSAVELAHKVAELLKNLEEEL